MCLFKLIAQWSSHSFALVIPVHPEIGLGLQKIDYTFKTCPNFRWLIYFAYLIFFNFEISTTRVSLDIDVWINGQKEGVCLLRFVREKHYY